VRRNERPISPLNWIPTAKEARQRGRRCAKIIERGSIFIALSGLVLILRVYRVPEGPSDSLITTPKHEERRLPHLPLKRHSADENENAVC
jgi:hypothetical protein